MYNYLTIFISMQIHLSFDPATLFLGMYVTITPGQCGMMCIKLFIGALFVRKRMQTIQVPTIKDEINYGLLCIYKKKNWIVLSSEMERSIGYSMWKKKNVEQYL